MATPYAFLDGSFVYNGVDLSPWTRLIQLDINPTLLDTTPFGLTNNSFMTRVAGLKDWKLTVEIEQDFAAGGPDATLTPDVISPPAGGRVVTVKPTSAAVSATNPRFFGNVFIDALAPISGAVGTLALIKISLTPTGALTRATT